MSMFHELMMKKKGIPSRYQEVEYIQADGTQWINTGITRDNLYKWRFEGIVNFQNVSTRQIMGCGSAVYFGCVNGFWQIGQIGTNNTGKTISANTDYSFSIEINSRNSKYKATINGDTIDGTTAEQSYVNVVNLFIFATDSHNYNCYAKLGYFKIYKDDVLVRNFIPVYDTETQKYGMWESVQGKFYGNDGTGDFKGSIVGYTIVGSPTISDGVVSGFSGSDYLKIPIPDYNKDFEIEMSFLPSSLNSTNIIAVNSYNRNGFYLVNSNLYFGIRVTDGNNTEILNVYTTISSNYKYICNAKRNGNKIVVTIYQDNILLTTKTISISEGYHWATDTNPLFIGNNFGGSFNGSIYIKECYIKMSNKLYFNGQQS